MRYLVVIEQGATSFGAYVPDLPGCVAAGETRDEALRLIREANDAGRIEEAKAAKPGHREARRPKRAGRHFF